MSEPGKPAASANSWMRCSYNKGFIRDRTFADDGTWRSCLTPMPLQCGLHFLRGGSECAESNDARLLPGSCLPGAPQYPMCPLLDQDLNFLPGIRSKGALRAPPHGRVPGHFLAMDVRASFAALRARSRRDFCDNAAHRNEESALPAVRCRRSVRAAAEDGFQLCSDGITNLAGIAQLPLPHLSPPWSWRSP